MVRWGGGFISGGRGGSRFLAKGGGSCAKRRARSAHENFSLIFIRSRSLAVMISWTFKCVVLSMNLFMSLSFLIQEPVRAPTYIKCWW